MSDPVLKSDYRSKAVRIESIDTLRGITILVMLFVNDLAGVKGVPAWMKHFTPSSADGMTFVDVVFPAFLFIVGMSIPFAIGGRLKRGVSLESTWQHILVRTLSLLVIGFFMVNSDYISSQGVLNGKVWTLLMYGAVILVWNTPPRDAGPKRTYTLALRLRVLGVALLVALVFFYRGGGDAHLIEMQPHWWGILGLIGWAYVIACMVYIPLRRIGVGIAGLLGVTGLLYCFYLADRAGAFPFLETLNPPVYVSSMFVSHTAIIVFGIILGMILTPDSPLTSHRARIRFGLLYGLGLATAGLLLHSLHDIHPAFFYGKDPATPAWALMSSAFTALIWVAVYWLMDVRGWKGWAKPVEPAGGNALFAYILAPMVYALFELLGEIAGSDFYFHLGWSFSVGFWRSVIFAFAVTWLAGGLRRMGIWLKL
jgi:predicted acyltransferase